MPCAMHNGIIRSWACASTLIESRSHLNSRTSIDAQFSRVSPSSAVRPSVAALVRRESSDAPPACAVATQSMAAGRMAERSLVWRREMVEAQEVSLTSLHNRAIIADQMNDKSSSPVDER